MGAKGLYEVSCDRLAKMRPQRSAGPWHCRIDDRCNKASRRWSRWPAKSRRARDLCGTNCSTMLPDWFARAKGWGRGLEKRASRIAAFGLGKISSKPEKHKAFNSALYIVEFDVFCSLLSVDQIRGISLISSKMSDSGLVQSPAAAASKLCRRKVGLVGCLSSMSPAIR